MIKTILRQIITYCAGAQDIIKKLSLCGPVEENVDLKWLHFCCV